MQHKRSIAVACATALLAATTVPRVALSSPKEELEAARQQLEAYGEQLAQTQTTLVMETNELNDLESQIVDCQEEADKTQDELDDARHILGEHMHDNYVSGKTSLVSVLVQSESIEDLIARIYYLDRVAERNAREIGSVRDLQLSLEEQLAELEWQRAEKEERLEQTAQEAEEYEQRIAQAKAYYDALDAEVRKQLEAEAQARKAEAQAKKPSVNEYGVGTDPVAVAQEAIQQPTQKESAATPPASQNADATQGQSGQDQGPGEDGTSKDASKQESQPNDANAQQEQTDEQGTSAESEQDKTTGAGNQATQPDEPSQNAPSTQPEEPQQTTTPAPTASASPASDAARNAVVSQAYQYLGVPYVWAGQSPSGFDCSGLASYVYEQCGISVDGNRTTGGLIDWIQSNGNWKTSMDELKPGDMVFPHTGHVGIYLGGGQMIHAPHPGTVVCVADVYAFYGGGWAG